MNEIDKYSAEVMEHIEMFKELMLSEAEKRHGISNEIVETLKQIEDDIADDFDRMMERASRLPDGTAVFMSSGFHVHREDGKPIPDSDVGRIKWIDGAPSFEEFMVAKAKQTPTWIQKKKRKKKNAPPTYEEYLESKLITELLKKKLSAFKRFQELVLNYMRRRMSDPVRRQNILDTGVSVVGTIRSTTVCPHVRSLW